MKLLLTISAIFFFNSSSGQQPLQKAIDSLLNELNKETVDSVKVNLLSQIVLKYAEVDPDKAIEYCNSGLAIAKKNNLKKHMSGFYQSLGNAYNNKGLSGTAVPFLDSALKLQQEMQDKKGIAYTKNNIAKAYFQQGNQTKATEVFFEALKDFEEIKDTPMIAKINFNIGAVYNAQNNPEKSLIYRENALKLWTAGKSFDNISYAYNSIGTSYIALKLYDKAKNYFQQSLALCRQEGNKRKLAMVYDCFGHLYDELNKPDSTLFYSLQALDIWNATSPNSSMAIDCNGFIGEAYLKLALNDSLLNTFKNNPEFTRENLLRKAEAYTRKAVEIADSTSDISFSPLYGKILADVYEQKGDYKKAFLTHKKYTLLSDSVNSQENKNKIAALEGEREVAIRDKKIELVNLSLAAQKKQRIALLAGLSLLGIIGCLLYYQSRTRKKTNNTLLILNNQLDDANKVKAKFFAILSHDLRSPVANLVNFLHLQKNEPGMFNAEQAAAHQKKISSSAENLLETMEAMLLWSKGQMGNFKPEIKTIAVYDVFEYMKKFFVSAENIQFKYSNPDNAIITTDENYLETIMHNLTANAIKALKNTPDATIEWSAKQEGEKTILSITDNGPGLDTEQANMLYTDNSITSSKTGFGLHLIRDLAKAIQCKISVSSKPGLGTTFTLAV